ncbi:hypothetical protein PABG_04116, partial [Paracoccidioides brasiliensis Pb03]
VFRSIISYNFQRAPRFQGLHISIRTGVKSTATADWLITGRISENADHPVLRSHEYSTRETLTWVFPLRDFETFCAKGSLTQFRSRISKFFGTPSQLASLERVNPSSVVEEPDYDRIGGFIPSLQAIAFHHKQYGFFNTSLREEFSQEYRKLLGKVLIKAPTTCLNLSRAILTFRTHGDHVCLLFNILGHHLDFRAAKYEKMENYFVKAVKVITQHLGLTFSTEKRDIFIPIRSQQNIVLEMENSNRTISQCLSEVPGRRGSQRGVTAPLREVIPTTLVSETQNLHIRIIDFGVGRQTISVAFVHETYYGHSILEGKAFVGFTSLIRSGGS